MNIIESFGAGIDEKQFLAGTEYEIENVEKHPTTTKYRLIAETDHSLRNSGFEYKTLALPYDDSLAAFKELMNSIKLKSSPEDSFSERTSIHVHVNVGTLSLQQAKQMVLIYALLEPLFFKYVGEVRESSIFCVPLSYTSLPKYYKESFEGLVNKWHKYTAFNILPTKKFGTIEFRHLYGTNDFIIYKEWLTALKSLYEFVRDNKSFQILEEFSKGMNVSAFAKDLVPTLLEGVTASSIEHLLYHSSLDVKLAVGGIK